MALELKADWLDNLHIATPCRANWERMSVVDDDDRVRFCGTCEKNVYNVSLMSRDDAKALIATHEGNLCVRLSRRKDGTLITSDCPVGQSSRRTRRRFTTALAALLMALVPSPMSNALAQASGWALRTVPGLSGLADMAQQAPPVRVAVGWWNRNHAPAPPPPMLMGAIAPPPMLPVSPTPVPLTPVPLPPAPTGK